ncbi:tetratricopeptide repeat protein, partial [bacterium]
GALTNQFIVSFLIMILPATLIGATFPCAAWICSASLTRLGKDVGRVYAVNTLGTIAGAFATGLFLIPWMGAQQAMVAGSALNVAIGALLVAASDLRRTMRLGAALLVVLAFGASVYLMPGWDIHVMVSGVSIYGPLYLHGGDEVQRFKADAAAKELLFYREGINATVSVERTAQMTSLKVDGKVDASNGSDMVTQLMLGHLPLVLHPKPERVLVIGLGSGVTAGAVAQHPMVRAIDIAEIEPAIIEASRFFAAENRNVLQDPRVRVVTADARHFILAAKERYDVISSEPSNPWMAGVANLFSREFYQLVRQRLADDGIMVQWVHSYSLFPRELKMIVNTFRQVFPHTTIWRTLEGDYLLIGTRERLAVDFAGLKARYEASPMIRNDLAVLGWRSPLALLTLFFLDEEDTARYAEGASENTDDRPLLEFAAPLALYARTSEENYRALKAARSQEFPPVRQLEPRLLEANRLSFARAFWARGHREEALEQLAKTPAEAPLAERIERAKLFFVLGKVAFATQEMAELAKRAPGDQMLQSYLRAGAVLNAYGFEEALREHTRTSTGKPNPTEAHNNLGLFYNAMGIRSGEKALFDLAIESFRAALGIEPEAYSIINNLGNAYFEKGMFEEASKAYQRVLEMKPDLAQTHFNLGLVYERLGDLDLAAREYRKALSLRPGWTLPLMNVRRLEATSVHGAQKK